MVFCRIKVGHVIYYIVAYQSSRVCVRRANEAKRDLGFNARRDNPGKFTPHPRISRVSLLEVGETFQVSGKIDGAAGGIAGPNCTAHADEEKRREKERRTHKEEERDKSRRNATSRATFRARLFSLAVMIPRSKLVRTTRARRESPSYSRALSHASRFRAGHTRRD